MQSTKPRAHSATDIVSKKRNPVLAVLTGASDGIGRQFAIALAKAGFDLVLVARRERELNELADLLRLESGVQTKVVALDLADPKSLDRLCEHTDALTVGLLILGAGVGTAKSYIDQPLSAELSAHRVDVRACAPGPVRSGFEGRANMKMSLALPASAIA